MRPQGSDIYFENRGANHCYRRTKPACEDQKRGNMKKTALVMALLLAVSATAFAQQEIDKLLAFAQIAAGPGLNSVLNITNRGTTTYTGSLNFFAMSGNTPVSWDPMVNGNTVSGGQWPISLPAGNTQTLTITTQNLATGFGTITPTGSSATDLTSFVEGNLTYYFLTGQTATDSVGVEPSDETYLTTIPFDNFSNIALALANTNTATATVNLTLNSAASTQLGTAVLSLAPNAHVAQYLTEIFPTVQGSPAGRLDLECDTSIRGVALTQVGASQYSSLPLQPSVRTYSWTVNFGGTAYAGLLSGRLFGSLGDIVTVTLTPTQESPRYIAGTFGTGSLTTVDYDAADNQIKLWTLTSYSTGASTINGTVQIWTITPFNYLGSGTISLTATN